MFFKSKIISSNLQITSLIFLFTCAGLKANAKTCEQILKQNSELTVQASEQSHSPAKLKSRSTAKETSALDLALALGVDPDLTELVKNPHIAQYVYLTYFAEKVGQNELRVALSDIVEDFEVNHVDLFNLLNKELDEALNDPDVKQKIEVLKSSGRIDRNLRPGRFRAATDRFFSQIKQTLNFIPSMKKAFSIVKEGMSKTSLYEGLFHFYGSTQLGLEDSKLRPWATTENGFADIRPNQIEGMSPMGWSMLAYFASETEAPIVNYSTTSGELTRGLNDALSKFLGTTWEEFEAYSDAQQKDFLQGFLQYDSADFCTAVWCKEERRHDPALMYVAQQVWGQVRKEEQSYPGADAADDYTNADDALKHLIGRNASEWTANAIYFFLGAHSSGPAAQWVDQPRIDETKHMAIFAASYKYFMGNQYFHRLKVMLDSMRSYSDLHKETNSVASEALSERVSLFELTVIHLFIEYRVRAYLKSIPLKTLAKLFERDPVAMTDRDESDLSPEKKIRIQNSLASEHHNGQMLARWKRPERIAEVELKEFERENKGLLEAMVLDTYFSFMGAEIPDGPEDKAFRVEFKRLKFGKGRKFDRLMRKSLNATLTDYQIMNNTWVQEQDDLVAEFASIDAGFEVRHRGVGEVDVLAVEKITDNHSLLRIKKPEGMVYSSGAAFKVTIKTDSATNVSRMLSLSNASDQDYIEFAMGDSDSDFKQAVIKLNQGSRVSVEKMTEGLDFNADKPLVFIAGGIGITPFRSFIQERFLGELDASDSPPVTLIYANRTEAPFEDELLDLSESSDQFTLHQIRSTQTSLWSGATGRIDVEYLKEVLPADYRDQEFYITGAPSMTEAMVGHLSSLGVSESNIHVEEFNDTSNTEATPSSSVYDGPLLTTGVLDAPGDLLCSCTGATPEEIQGAIDRGNTTVEEIRADLGKNVGGVCGGCKSGVLDIIKSTDSSGK